MSSGVEFEEDSFSRSYGQVGSPAQGFSSGMNSYQSYAEPEAKGMTGWLIKKGIVKSPQGAQMMLVGVIIFNLIVTAIFLAIFFK